MRMRWWFMLLLSFVLLGSFSIGLFKGGIIQREAAELARILVGVVEACHSLGVMHRDLKPENFLFVNQEEEASLKTIDFGLSMFFRPGEFVGSPFYVAPEVLRKNCGPECDVWIFDVLLYCSYSRDLFNTSNLWHALPCSGSETEQGIFELVL